MPIEEKLWHFDEEASVILVALDVCGFSKNTELEEMHYHRDSLFDAVNNAPEVQELVSSGVVEAQFIGDELRFAFLTNIEKCPRKVRDFVHHVFIKLNETETNTKLKGVVLQCDLVLRDFMGCRFFDGTAAVQCSDWLGCAGADEVLINKAFKTALYAERIPSDFTELECCKETVFVFPPLG